MHCDFSWVFRENEMFFVFFVPSKILGGPGFVAFFLRLVGGRSLCDTDFSWIFRAFALLWLAPSMLRFFVFSWIFRAFALLWLPLSLHRFFVFFVDFSWICVVVASFFATPIFRFFRSSDALLD